ncbi:MAG: DNA/RNA non-specific endonuclease [Bacteroidota bacterium]
MKTVLALIIGAISLSISCGSDEEIVGLTDYTPIGKNTEIVKHQFYSLSYSEPDEQAEWVAYLLTSTMATGSVEREDDFRIDPMVATGSATLEDYKGSGYDRGHLCPAADMSFSEEAMSETFYMSNMSPQDPSFNRGIWKSLEEQVRNWASLYDSLYVITGPVLTSNKDTIGPNEVSVPKYYYKVILDYCLPEIKMIAFILPNEKGTGSIQDYVVSTDSVESITGIDFFPKLPDTIEEQLESTHQSNSWELGATPLRTQNVQQKSSSGSTQQCLGTAKSTGSRCKNVTTNANGYCTVHQYQAPGYFKPPATGISPDGKCMATTKAGTRCKRNAEPDSKYCWQHQR